MKCVSYVRVSGRSQVKEATHETQIAEIEAFVAQQGWHLIEHYIEPGKSGESVKKRPVFQRLMADAHQKKFEAVIVWDTTRFSRNTEDTLRYHRELTEHGVSYIPLKANIDYTTDEGKLMLTNFAAIAEYERKKIMQRMKAGKVHKTKQGKPACGFKPYGRLYDKETGKWSLDERKAKFLREAVDRYLTGGNLRTIIRDLKVEMGISISYQYLLKVLKKNAGSKWTIHYQGEEPITIDVPPLLPDEIIKAVHARIEHRNKYRKPEKEKYLLRGFVRCGYCKKNLVGQTPQHKPYKYLYYRHLNYGDEPCKKFRTIKGDKLEDFVFDTISKFFMDEPAFKKALKGQLPDEDYIDELNKMLAEKKKALTKCQKDIKTLAQVVLDGVLRQSTVAEKEVELIEAKERLEGEIISVEAKLKTLPNPTQLKDQALEIRERLAVEFSDKAHWDQLSFDDKREVLQWLFGNSKKYGIFVFKEGKRSWRYEIKTRMYLHPLTAESKRNEEEPLFSYAYDILGRKHK